MRTLRLFKPRAVDHPEHSSVRVRKASAHNSPDGLGNDNSVSSRSLLQNAKDAQAESVAKCLDAFKDEALDTATGKVTAASVLALANLKREEKAPVEGSKTDKVLKWAVSFAKNVNAYSKVLNAYISNAPEIAGLVWTGCSILLQTGLNHVDVLEKLFATLNRIGENIGRFQQYEALFGESERMQYALALIYTDVLELSVGAALFYRKHGFLNYLSSIVKTFDARFGSNLASFYQHKELLEDEVWAAYLGRVLGKKPDFSVKDLRRWLAAPNMNPIISIQAGSMQLQSVSQGLVSGSSLIWKTLSKQKSDRFWSFDQTDKLQGGNEQYRCSTFDLVRAFLLQLLETNVGSSAIHQRLAVTFGKSVQSNVTRDSENLLWKDLKEILAALDHVILVIDGLDELDDGERSAQNVMQHFASICEYRESKKKSHFKIIMTTRPLQLDFMGQTFSIQSQDTNSDIANYVDIKLDEMAATSTSPFHRVQPNDRSKIASEVKKGADGMILWAKLILEDMAGKKTLKQMYQCLENAPAELTQVYSKLYEDLNRSNLDTKIVLEWLLCCQRPLSLAEIEAILETDADEPSVSKRLTPISLDIQDACGPLIEMSSHQPYTVQLVHYSVRQWMLREGSPAFSLQRSHLRAFRTTAAYLSLMTSDMRCAFEEEMPVLVPSLSQEYKLRSLCQDHALLEYSTLFWISHLSFLQTSSPNSTAECTEGWGDACRLLSINTPNLAVMEAILWRVHGSYSELKKMYQSAFDMRLEYLAPETSEMIQTVANLASVYELLHDYAGASAKYQQAWVACQNHFGHQQSITFAFADAFALNLEKQEKGVDTEQVYLWMWQSLQNKKGNDHEETLTMASRLAWMYQRHERYEEANNLYREIWETWTRKLGHLDEQTILAAGYYARALQLVGQNEIAIEVHLARLQASSEQLPKTDRCYLAALIAVAQAYEFAGLPEKAESIMKDTMKDLNVVDDTPPMKAKASMTICIELARLLQRCSRSDDAQLILKEQFSWCKVQVDFGRRLDGALLELLKEFAEELQKHELFTNAKHIISWLHDYFKHFEGSRSEGALNSIYWLAQIALDDTNAKEELELLQAAYNTAKKGAVYDEATLESSRRLALSIHRREDWEALEMLSREVLEHVWPSVLIEGPQQQLPNEYAKEAVVVARRLALAYQKEDMLLRSRWFYDAMTSQPLDKAENIYSNIHSSYISSDGPDDKNTLGAAAELGKFYESRCKFDQAKSVYQLVYDAKRGALGPSHASTLRSLLKLTKFHERRGDWSKSKNLQEGALEQITSDWGSQHPFAVEIEMSLVNVRSKLGNTEPTGLMLATRQKGNFQGGHEPSTECTSKNTVLNELYKEQLKASKGTDLSLDILKHTQSLYEDCAGQFNRTSIKGAMRIGDLLERHKLDIAAAHWYEYVVTRKKDQTVSPVLYYEPTRRLAHLYEVSGKTEEAERIYKLNWQHIKSKVGGNPADESSLRAFRDLFRFFQRIDPSQEKSLGLLESAWKDMKAQKGHVDAFHKAAELIINCYSMLGRFDTAFRICREAVYFLPNGKLEDRSWKLLRVACAKCGHDVSVTAVQLQLENQVSLGVRSAANVVAIAREAEKIRQVKDHKEDGYLTALTHAYEFWKSQDPVGEITCSLGDIRIECLGVGHRSDEKNKLLEERWSLCRNTRGYLDGVTIKAAKDLGREDATLEVWNAHKEALGCDSATTLAVGEDLAKHCSQSPRSAVGFKLFEDLFTTCWSAKNHGPVHEKTIQFGVALARQYWLRNDYKSADELHMKLFDALRSDENTPLLLSLSKYKELARSCYYRNSGDWHGDSTSQGIILHTLNISKTLEGYYARSTLDLLDHYHACCKYSPSPSDKEDLLEIYKDFYNHGSQSFTSNEPRASAIGRTLAQLYFASGHENLALNTISDVISRDERSYGLTHRHTIASYNSKSALLFDRADYQAALNIHEKILRAFAAHAMTTMVGGAAAHREDYSDLLRQYHLKGRALQRLGRFAEARGIYDEAFSMSSRLFGPRGFYEHKLDNIKMWSQKGFEGS